MCKKDLIKLKETIRKSNKKRGKNSFCNKCPMTWEQAEIHEEFLHLKPLYGNYKNLNQHKQKH